MRVMGPLVLWLHFCLIFFVSGPFVFVVVPVLSVEFGTGKGGCGVLRVFM